MKKHRPTREELCARTAERLNKIATNADLPNPEHIDKLTDGLQGGIDRLRFGKATQQDMANFEDAVNVCLKLITDENFPEALIHTKAAEAALQALDERRAEVGRWVTKSYELDSLDAFIPIHDAITRNSPHIEIERACKAVREDLKVAA